MTKEQATTAWQRSNVLDAWLERVHAVKAWSVNVSNVPGLLTAYVIGGHVVIVQRYERSRGWQLYLPSSKSNSIDVSLDAAAEFCGVDGCRGLLEPSMENANALDPLPPGRERPINLG